MLNVISVMNDRNIAYTSPYGDIIKKSCPCSESVTKYRPDKTNIVQIDLYKKRDGSYISATPKYESKDYDYSFCKLEFKQYVDKFDKDKAKELGRYRLLYEIVYTSEEVCQKYCDYLNCNKED